MLTGLEILLARMKTNPEEFLNERGTVPYEGEMFGGKWSDLLDYAWRVADKDEREMLETARKEFYRDDFNERVMKRLAGEEVKQETSPFIIKQQAPHWTDPRSIQGALHPLQNSAQNSALQGGTISTTIGQSALQANGFGQAQIKAEGQPVGYAGMGEGFWGGIAKTLGGR
jgi:hypothetical protein